MHCPYSLPPSKYLFDKALNNSRDTFRCKFQFCCECMTYLGTVDQLPGQCSNCAEGVDHEQKVKEGKFFLVFPLAEQLKYLWVLQL